MILTGELAGVLTLFSIYLAIEDCREESLMQCNTLTLWFQWSLLVDE